MNWTSGAKERNFSSIFWREEAQVKDQLALSAVDLQHLPVSSGDCASCSVFHEVNLEYRLRFFFACLIHLRFVLASPLRTCTHRVNCCFSTLLCSVSKLGGRSDPSSLFIQSDVIRPVVWLVGEFGDHALQQREWLTSPGQLDGPLNPLSGSPSCPAGAEDEGPLGRPRNRSTTP